MKNEITITILRQAEFTAIAALDAEKRRDIEKT
jgi:hypothetical protein